MKKKILVIDHYFKDFKGHHFNYNKYINDNFNQNKYDLEFFFNENIKKEIEEKFDYKINKIFTNVDVKTKLNSFKSKLNKIKSILKKIDILKKIYYSILKKNHFIFNLFKNYIMLRLKSSELINKLTEIDKKNKNAMIFIHSLSVKDFLEFINNIEKFSNNNYYVVYRRDPREINFCLNYISKVFIQNKNLKLLTDSHKIKDYLVKKKIPTKLINIPIFFDEIRQKSKKSKKLNISYLGDARVEKGFFNIPNLISNIVNNSNYDFIIQANSNGYDINLYKLTIKKLLSFRKIKLIKKELSEKQYFRYLKKSDVILLPYLQNNYQFRTSGIFFEAIYANKIAIITNNTWMSSYYESNKILNKLILDKENNLKKILIYIYNNKLKILTEIKNLKKKIQKIQQKNHISKVFYKTINKNKETYLCNYIIDDHTVNRKSDGNQWGSSFLLNNINRQINTKNIATIFYNKYNIDVNEQLILKNNFFSNITKKYFDINVIETNRFFELNNNKLIFKNYYELKDIKISNYFLINFHYFSDLISSLSILADKKIIIIIHDRYKKINNESDVLLDKKNLYYVFVSFQEFYKCNFKFAKKYLLIPHNFHNIHCMKIKNKKKYNYYFVSSGSDVDIKNLKFLLNNIKFNSKINIVGEIVRHRNLFKNYSDQINFLGYIKDLKQIYLNESSVFLIPRYFGTGVPIKFLECLKFSAKSVLFGDQYNFGLPYKILSKIFTAKKNNLDKFVQSRNYFKIYSRIYSYILENNNKFLKKFKKEVKNDYF